MLNDISTSFNKRNRPSLSDKSFDVPLLKAIIYARTQIIDRNNCIKIYLKNTIRTYDSPDKVYSLVDEEFKSVLLYEANLQFSKALYNWSIYKKLVSKGLWSWACVTLYYAQFYCINGLLNIQGNGFSRPILLTSSGEEKEIVFHVYTEDFAADKFIIEMRNYKPHEDVWRQYYNVYKKYKYSISSYHELYQYDVENPFEILEIRHRANYDTAFLFEDFIEYLLPENELEEFALKMQNNIFTTFYTEDEFLKLEYIASLRIKLLFDILHAILGNKNLETIRTDLYLQRKNMLNNIKDDTPVKECFLNWIGENQSII
ncbi:hypothetical protein NIES37_41160 [Tolypothrix tenuis PCC 7101]|uniref:Uncharacterized protein n=1 Tax=Tolypothrix tenuis PCC 7101 TaxID=231146 RepID=A0A1Z4N2Z3_9CYAN|nr:hypothetical protein [Aulosira sp. FACHB-113]BAZ00133.1 hypothetical protein NIES37_41160 [Tolypothrix tenuis PCC 7101]BAZ75946.1 hypothetical protein NIES50_45430 [Aulosira laxa NIES-50]